jgi:hypothetical protein
MKTMNSDPVQDYILEDKNHLRIAAAVFDAWPEIRKKLVSDFLDRLHSRLQEKLKGWKFDRWGRPFINEEGGFNFWKPAWKEEYYVSLHLGSYGQEVTFGLARNADKERISQCSPDPELLTAVRERYPSASARKWREAEVTMQSPAADWGKPEVLWRMRDEKDPFLEEVADQLLEVAEISEPFVDRLAGKK